MNLKQKFSIAVQSLVVISMFAILVAACSSSGSLSGFAQTYSASAGAGEVLQFSVDTMNMTYSYADIGSSYNDAGSSGTGSLVYIGGGIYIVGSSNDGFIQSGRVFPIQNGFLVGHVVISTIGGLNIKIPVFGISSPITSITQLTGNYNYQGFGCTSKSFGNVLGASFGCLSHFGTVIIANANSTTENFTKCKSGNSIINASGVACAVTQSGTISATLTTTPGVFDLYDSVPNHIGWLFAFTAPNGQIVAAIDHDDPLIGEFGHTVLSTYASSVPGAADGKYFIKNNFGGEHLVTISGVTITSTINPGVNGTLTYDSPWPGLTQYTIAASGAVVADSGVAMIAGTGAFTHTDNAFPALFAVGVRYSQ